MRAIFKYELKITDEQKVLMPCSAILLHVAYQGDKLYVWAKVNTDYLLEERPIHIHGTGNPIAKNPGNYVGTVHSLDGFVWHIFEG